MCSSYKEPRFFLSYTLDEWADIFEVMEQHEDTQETAFAMMDDMAYQLQAAGTVHVSEFAEVLDVREYAIDWLHKRLSKEADGTD